MGFHPLLPINIVKTMGIHPTVLISKRQWALLLLRQRAFTQQYWYCYDRAFTRQHKRHLPGSFNVVKTVADSPSNIDIVKTVGMIQPTVLMLLRQWHSPGSINIVKTMGIHPVILIL